MNPKYVLPVVFLATAGTAVSSEAQDLRQLTSKVVSQYESSEALFGPRAELISKLWAIYHDAQIYGWDGYGAISISRKALDSAEAFVRALPPNIELPEVAGESTGLISFDWQPSKNRLATLSIGLTDRIAFAWVDGADRGHAVESFDGMSIPNRIRSILIDLLRG